MIVDTERPALSVSGLSKTFGGERALREVSLTIKAGEIHGIVGENGSGKSTLIKLLAGFHQPDETTAVMVCGQEAELPFRPGQAQSLGIAFVHQELGLIDDVSVLENLLLESFAVSYDWWISWATQRARALAVLSEFDLPIDPDQRVGELRPTDRALLAVARAVAQIRMMVRDPSSKSSGLLVLDEPTVYLPARDRQRLFDLMRSISRTGVAILFVAHDIEEVLKTTDRVTVLRDGEVLGTVESAATSADRLIAMILGTKHLERGAKAVRAGGRGIPDFRVAGLAGHGVRSLSLDGWRGDIIGLTGLPGSGFDDVPYMLFGAKASRAGVIELASVTHLLVNLDPGSAVRLGIALIPADRSRAGAVGSLTVVDNVTLQVLQAFRHGPFLSRSAMVQGASRTAEVYDVRPRDPKLNYASLSGGNQQKVLLAKWLQGSPRVLLLHEPTQGVDVGAREEIFRLLRKAADDGCVIIVASTDHEQIAALCNRVLITRAGDVVHDLDGPALSKERVTELSYGRSDNRTAAE